MVSPKENIELERKEIILPVSGTRAVIREGDGYADKKLTQKNKNRFELVYEYLAFLTESLGDLKKITADSIKKLLIPDHEYLAVECYRLNYGDELEFLYTCSNCSEESNHVIDLSSLELRQPSPESSGFPDPTITITLPRSRKTAEIGMLNGHKEIQLIQQEISAGLDLNRTDFFSIRSLNGSKDFSYEDIVTLPLADHVAIRKARKKLICGYDTNIAVRCPNCSNKNTVNIMMSKDFLFPGF